jgi:chromosome segregation ATPase
MSSLIESPKSRKFLCFSKGKSKTPTFYNLKLFRHNANLSYSNLWLDIQNGNNNFTLKVSKNKKLILKRPRKPLEYDSENLKNDLMSFRSEVEKRKNELLRLKIKYSKLMLDNINNKTLLAQILSIPKNKLITKGALLFKIRSCKLNNEERQSLKNAHEILKLKLELNSKKKLLTEKTTYLNSLIENSKLKVINNLQDEYFIKCEQQRKLLNKLHKLEKRYNNNERKVNEIKDNIKKEDKESEFLYDREGQGVDILNQSLDQRGNLMKQIHLLNDKIKKHEKDYISKEKIIREKEQNNSSNEKKLKLIKEYLNIRSEKNNEIIQLTKSQEMDETILKNYSQEIESLKNELNNLYNKINYYREEKPRLLRKSKESKKDIEKMISLNKELETIKNLKKETEQKHNNKQNELNEINNEFNIINKQYDEKREENINIKNELNKKIEELKEKLKEIKNKNNILEQNINKEKDKFNELEQNEIELKNQLEENDLITQQNIKKINEEKKKKIINMIKSRKLEIEQLKKEQNKLSNNNRILEDENKVLQDELNGFDVDLNNYEEIEKDYNEAISKLNNLKNE